MYGIIIAFWLLVGPLGGFAIGNSKGRGAIGLVAGLALGPLFGWLLVGLMEPSPEVQDARRRALAYHLAHPPSADPLARPTVEGLAAPVPTSPSAGRWVDPAATKELSDALEIVGVPRRDARRIVDAFAFCKNGHDLLPQLLDETRTGDNPNAIAERVKALVDQAPKFKL